VTTPEPGRFITFEGGEGAGKTTQLRLLALHLRGLGRDVVTTREPGGSTGAEQIRDLLVQGAAGRWDGVSEALLHFAARRDHLRHTVWPALRQGSWVLCDRFADSTTAYQGYGFGVALASIEQLYQLAVGDFQPDLTLILDLPAAQGLARAVARGGDNDRYERMDLAFHQRLRDGFLRIAEAAPRRCAVISAEDTVDAIAARIQTAVEQRLA
jgi:dTMP kinase